MILLKIDADTFWVTLWWKFGNF